MTGAQRDPPSASDDRLVARITPRRLPRALVITMFVPYQLARELRARGAGFASCESGMQSACA